MDKLLINVLIRAIFVHYDLRFHKRVVTSDAFKVRWDL